MANVRPPFWLGHNREFIYGPRGFNSIEEHDKTIIQNWNSLVSWEDEVWLLGDCILNDNESGIRKLNQLAGKIYIIAGNHDSANRIQMYANIRPTILIMGLAYILKYQGYHFYLSHYQTITSNFLENDKPLKRRLWNIHGHTHSIEKFSLNYPCCYNVCLDAHNCRPVLLDEIIKDINNYHNSQGQK